MPGVCNIYVRSERVVAGRLLRATGQEAVEETLAPHGP
jgi:hypothetical protein